VTQPQQGSSARFPEGRGSRGRPLPLALKLGYTLFLCILVPVYWRHYGPSNFLWGSDVALFLVLGSLWSGRSLPNSMVAVGILPFDIAWCVDFATGAALFGATDYMFEAGRPLFLRALSLFHVVLPVLVVHLLCRLGYDRRALPAQIALTWILLPMTYLLTDPAKNINLAFGLGHAPQSSLDSRLYLLLFMLALPLVVLWPMHALLCRLFPRRRHLTLDSPGHRGRPM